MFPVKYVFKAKVDNDTATFIILVGKHAKNSMYYFDVFDGKQRYRYKLFNKEPIYDEVRKLAYGIIKSTADKQKKRNRVTDEAILAKFILPQLFFQSPKYFFSSLKKKGNEYLKSIALEINNKGIYKKIIKADAIYSRVDNIKNEIALFKFPTPTKVSDSYYSAVFSEKSGDNKNRYFSFDKVGERSEAVALIEITIDKVINHGLFHGKPTKMSFFNAIASTFDREQLL